MPNTAQEYDKVIDICQDIFVKKMQDYGTAWRILRPTSITDQKYIKANRIRSIEEKGITKVGPGNDTPQDEVLRLYQNYFHKAKELMLAKNHDYDEAWREMRVSSYTDLILMKINRTKQIEDHQGTTIISEGIDANYFDMVNYAVFGLIRLVVEQE